MVLDVGGGVSCAAAVHDGYVLNKPLKKSPLGGDLLTELALKAVSLHDPVPPIQPVYCVKRYGDQPVAHSSYHKYTQLQARRMHGPGVCMACVHGVCAWRCARRVHGACMACAWRVHGVCMARAWRVHGACMACAWHLRSGGACIGTCGEAQPVGELWRRALSSGEELGEHTRGR